jgi:hypothetical protein
MKSKLGGKFTIVELMFAENMGHIVESGETVGE